MTTWASAGVVLTFLFRVTCRRSWQNAQGRGERARHPPDPGGVRPLLLRGPHRVQGQGRLHGHRALSARCQYEPLAR